MICLASDAGAQAQDAAPAAAESSPVAAILNAASASRLGLKDAAALQAFYDARQGQTFWSDSGGVNGAAGDLIQTLENSWQHGLNPGTYHVRDIEALTAESDALKLAMLDVLLTDAFARYVHDMSGMRVRAEILGLDRADWLQPYKPAQALAFLSDMKDMNGFLQSLAPKSYTYKALQNELIRLSQEKEEPYAGILPIGTGGVSLSPGMRSRAVPNLRIRFGIQPQTDDPWLYDDALAASIMRFQKESGLQDDGLIGPTTLKLINRSRRARMLQIVANLERLRWVAAERPARFVMVNVPAATAWAIEDGKVAVEMPVIVGKPERPTTSFIASITGVRFNPDWTVPPTIKQKDILPKLQADPNYLANKGMALMRTDETGRQAVDPLTVDWANVTPKELGRLDMVQIPGDHNPLGHIRILMPNEYNIYLHDTNEPEYFGRHQRAQSSGCIRMKDPAAMARFVLAQEVGWNEERMENILASGKTYDAKISETIPVYILYYTVWADDDGRIVYGNDIYDWDVKLLDELSAINGFWLPK